MIDIKEKKKVCNKSYYLKNREQLRLFKKIKYKENRESILKRCKNYNDTHKVERGIFAKKYYRKNREHFMVYNKKYYKDNKEIIKIQHQACAVSRLSTLKITVDDIQRVYEDNVKKHGTLTCVLCCKPIKFGEDSVEHLTPKTRGGTNEYSNLAIAHRNCNSRKGNKTLIEWRNHNARKT